MLSFFDPLRSFSFASVLFRLFLALLSGGVIGYGRSRFKSAAGLRTYMLISLGAALCVLITLYEYEMLKTQWSDAVDVVGMKYDASRIAASAIAGIGFLGAGTILKVKHQQVKGLTTATGLLATVCMSLAAGAGFFECVILVLIIIEIVLNIMTPLEVLYKRRLRNITLNVEMESITDVSEIQSVIERENAVVYEIDFDNESDPVSAIYFIQMSRDNSSHSAMLSSIAELSCVKRVRELIS